MMWLLSKLENENNKVITPTLFGYYFGTLSYQFQLLQRKDRFKLKLCWEIYFEYVKTENKMFKSNSTLEIKN